MIRIDGSFGEGGGQILRTSLSLSLVTGQPFAIENIRAGRAKPGLLRQHLTAVLAAAEVGAGQADGAELGSQALTFTPGRVRAGEYHFAVGTAGSGTLVLQTVLPALLLADGPSRVIIEGGTHNQAAPPFEFLAKAFLPLVERMGPKVTVALERYGFYPAGGGRFTVSVEPCPALRPVHLEPRGDIVTRKVTAVLANLQRHIGRREVDTALSMLNWAPEAGEIVQTRESPGPGNVVMIEAGSAQGTEVFTAFGQLGVTAEKVAATAARETREYLVSRAVAGEHLTDQLLLPMALAGRGSFAALKISRHAQTNMAVIPRFLPVRFETAEEEGYVRVAVVAVGA